MSPRASSVVQLENRWSNVVLLKFERVQESRRVLLRCGSAWGCPGWISNQATLGVGSV